MAEDFRNQHIDFHNERYQTVRASLCKGVNCMTGLPIVGQIMLTQHDF